ncbi:MAG: hypothetical protein EOO20_15075 [Chryseobacterium sp.]|jgi:preprotein translocase subunit SecB|uniref:hypothetical protein n=1 Tax=Pedobacter sp. Leaf41 TaxID=1736218 RepID=UPI000A9E11A0|nr:hypothetical protein [Pedobacter sp. Leaf41]RZJ87855.1 MAG: hypothetical protein EOO20_15075 [Chryseobacterium sp.]
MRLIILPVTALLFSFPYVRSYISAVTASSELPAINLPLLNFPKKIGDELRSNTQENNSLESLEK